MTEFISESDLDRIAKFTATPQYKRSPEQLIPTDEE